MNLFLPEETIVDSVEALDDKRLIKQILECKTILDVDAQEVWDYSYPTTWKGVEDWRQAVKDYAGGKNGKQ